MRPMLQTIALFTLLAAAVILTPVRTPLRAQPVAAGPAVRSAPGSAAGLADDPRVARRLHLLATWVEAQRAYEEIPGVSMAVVVPTRGEGGDVGVLWSGAFGLADREAGTPATPETIYSICSISKLFTAVAAMQLRDRGEVDLHAPLSDYLPWFDLEQAYPDGPPVTLWGMLTHSAGLPREADYPYWSPPEFDFPSREEIRRRLGLQQTLYPAQSYFQYSNLGLTLVGEVVAEVSGRPYGEYVRSEILEPLGLEDTRPEVPAELAGGRLAAGYGAPTRSGTRERLPLFDAEGIAPAAGFSSTVEDLARFGAWQLRVLHRDGAPDGEGDEERILARNTLREMQRVQWLDPDWETARGLGFGVYRRGDVTYVGHSGSCPGYRSALWIQPDDRFAATAMANANGVDTELLVRRAHEIVAPAIDEVLGEDGEADPIDPDLLRFAGHYSVAPWGGEVAVLPWKDGLAMLDLPTEDPLDSLSELRHEEGSRFRRVRDDGEPGEEIVFEVDAEGTVTAMVQHANSWRRVDPPAAPEVPEVLRAPQDSSAPDQPQEETP